MINPLEEREMLRQQQNIEDAAMAEEMEDYNLVIYRKTFRCGKTVFVTAYLVGFVGGHPSGVDYYREKRGYACGFGEGSDEKVTDQYHKNFCACTL